MTTKPGFIDQWHVRGTLLSPLHIGTGEPLDPFRCVLDQGKLHEFDLHAALAEADSILRNRLSERLAKPIVTRKQAEEVHALLTQTPWRNHILHTYNLSVHANQKLDRTDTWGTWGIYPFIHNPTNGKRYIPGSSLKGALRTGVVNIRSLSLKTEFPQHVESKQKNRWLEERSREIERKALTFSRIEDDPFSEWFVSDMFFNDRVQSVLHGVNIVYLKEKERSGRPGSTSRLDKFPHLVEAVSPKGDGPHFEGLISRRPHHRRLPEPVRMEEFTDGSRSHTRSAFSKTFVDDTADGDWYENLDERTCEFLEKIEDNLDKKGPESAVILRLGRFGGFLFKTIEKHRILKEHKISDRIARPELHGDQANPNTRMFADDGQPFGFVILEFIKL